MAAVDTALDEGETDVDIAPFAIAPLASTEAATHIDTSAVVSKYETHFGYLGGQSNRGQNVARAASQMDGVVLMPGDIVSFNANVGPRTIENGFTTAPGDLQGRAPRTASAAGRARSPERCMRRRSSAASTS